MNSEAISKAASTATYTGATISSGSAAAMAAIPPSVQETIFGLTLNQWTVMGIGFGMLMAFAGWVTNLVYKHRLLMLAQSKYGEQFTDGD